MKIAVVGLGDVGTVTGACLTQTGHTVIGVDVNPVKIGQLNEVASPITEIRLDEMVRAEVRAGHLWATSDIAGAVAAADVVLVCVGTPSGRDGDVHLQDVRRVIAEIGGTMAHLDGWRLIHITSTVPPGTVAHEIGPLLEHSSGKSWPDEFGVAFSPEFLHGDTATDVLSLPQSVVAADDDRSFEAAQSVYAAFADDVIRRSISVAEMVKLSRLVSHAPPTSSRRRRILILVENLAVPFDRRVWQEARTLQEAGYDVSVICPKSTQHPESFQTLEGVRIYRYPSPFEARRTAGYLIEYPQALVSQLVLAIKVARAGRIDVIQACNPPDLLFLVALPFRLLTGTRFIFDHHDASPELLIAKGRRRGSRIVRFAELLERWTFSGATVSMATNESYRRIAVERGGMSPDDVFVVRSGPDLSRFAAAQVDPELRRGKQYLVAYVGVMGIQEGIDYLLEAADLLVNKRGRTDVQFTLAGSGPEFSRVVDRVAELGLADNVALLGRVSEEVLAALLTTADLCVNPDEWNEMNDISTMNKILEYMALGKPIVQFDLREGRVSAGGASLYARPNDAESLADGIAELLDDEAQRARMGAIGHERFESTFSWEHSAPALLAAYRQALARTSRVEPPTGASRRSGGRRVLDRVRAGR
ncbi:glycosyltransferase [Pengzhenrongella frigida]|uniref:Glycosyltransferase n=1 Tax=Pengzhenrongella frigida TaxID=1259133 RepID=A0A4Q5MYL7_9MICO|nr:glycosyltransferase [Cellulomonas sp. HLT2-17]RYV50769.1 glycosyltransferase [Cellulomonas sp. HLT2-17]